MGKERALTEENEEATEGFGVSRVQFSDPHSMPFSGFGYLSGCMGRVYSPVRFWTHLVGSFQMRVILTRQ